MVNFTIFLHANTWHEIYDSNIIINVDVPHTQLNSFSILSIIFQKKHKRGVITIKRPTNVLKSMKNHRKKLRLMLTINVTTDEHRNLVIRRPKGAFRDKVATYAYDYQRDLVDDSDGTIFILCRL